MVQSGETQSCPAPFRLGSISGTTQPSNYSRYLRALVVRAWTRTWSEFLVARKIAKLPIVPPTGQGNWHRIAAIRQP